MDYVSESSSLFESFRAIGRTSHDVARESRDFSVLVEQASSTTGPTNTGCFRRGWVFLTITRAESNF